MSMPPNYSFKQRICFKCCNFPALNSHLCSPETKARLMSWLQSECPEAENMERLQQLKAAYATKRIQQEINKWDNETRDFEQVQDRLMSYVHDQCSVLENELQKEELKLAGQSPDRPESTQVYEFEPHADMPKQNDNFSSIETKHKVLLGVTAPLWVPLGLVVGIIALPTFGIKRLLQKQK